MDNLVFSLNATVPIFLMMILGLFFNKIGWMDEEFANKMNKFVFRVPLPVLLFGDLAVVDIKEAWDTKFVIFCFIITLISITIRNRNLLPVERQKYSGEFIQGRTEVVRHFWGSHLSRISMVIPVRHRFMIIGSVPLYNIMAVVVLSFSSRDKKAWIKALIKKTLIGIITNPIIIGIVAGLLWSALKLPMPVILHKAVSSIGGVATPMGLMAMGAYI